MLVTSTITHDAELVTITHDAVGDHHTWLPQGCIDGGESRSVEREQGSKGATACFQQTI